MVWKSMTLCLLLCFSPHLPLIIRHFPSLFLPIIRATYSTFSSLLWSVITPSFSFYNFFNPTSLTSTSLLFLPPTSFLFSVCFYVSVVQLCLKGSQTLVCHVTFVVYLLFLDFYLYTRTHFLHFPTIGLTWVFLFAFLSTSARFLLPPFPVCVLSAYLSVFNLLCCFALSPPGGMTQPTFAPSPPLQHEVLRLTQPSCQGRFIPSPSGALDQCLCASIICLWKVIHSPYTYLFGPSCRASGGLGLSTQH